MKHALLTCVPEGRSDCVSRKRNLNSDDHSGKECVDRIFKAGIHSDGSCHCYSVDNTRVLLNKNCNGEVSTTLGMLDAQIAKFHLVGEKSSQDFLVPSKFPSKIERNFSSGSPVGPKHVEKLWEGLLQLNASTTVPVVAFFRSGEKASKFEWPKLIEVKGKVKLDAFEKFIQQLPCSRSRGLMVTSFIRKAVKSDIKASSLKEVALGYEKGRRIGFAELSRGVVLYMCPRTDSIITILAKCGFFKGKTVVERNQNSLIGCIVWRRNRTLSLVLSERSSKQGQTSLMDGSGHSHPEFVELHKQNSKRSEAILSLPDAKNTVCEDWKKSWKDDKLPLSVVPVASIPDFCYQQNLQKVDNLVGNPQKRAKIDDHDLPEFDFSTVCSILPSPVNELDNKVFSTRGSNSVMPLKVNWQHKSYSNLLRKSLADSNGLMMKMCVDYLADRGDDDMPEWCPPQLPYKSSPLSATSDALHPLCLLPMSQHPSLLEQGDGHNSLRAQQRSLLETGDSAAIFLPGHCHRKFPFMSWAGAPFKSSYWNWRS